MTFGLGRQRCGIFLLSSAGFFRPGDRSVGLGDRLRRRSDLPSVFRAGGGWACGVRLRSTALDMTVWLRGDPGNARSPTARSGWNGFASGRGDARPKSSPTGHSDLEY